MHVRRVVTGLTAEGKATVVSDDAAPWAHDFVHIPGMSETILWTTEPEPRIDPEGEDPTAALTRVLPAPGGTRFAIVRFPPDAVFAHPGFDGEAAAAEQRRVAPDLAELFEAEAPGMHTTESVDYALVVEGEIWLELDDGETVHLDRGDVVVQNGTRHAWRNKSDAAAVIAFVNVGATRR